VTDARFAPFRSGSFDLVMLKEFVHHVREYRTVFRETNRVLRHSGVLALMDPVRSV
jgi:ubiquinone/menaquinone biosynthesis C-methylase UbiE